MENIILEQAIELYEYLKGESSPGQFRLSKAGRPKLTPRKAFQIIYILQEHFRIIPDTYEQCWSCKELFDCSGLYWESKATHYCNSCSYQVPENYDRGKR